MKTLKIATVGLIACAAVWPGPPAGAQQAGGVVAAALRMRQLDGVKRVLMIAAHPDDEDTGLLTALARGMGAETAYLSLSRGEGGQNLIGPRLHEGLGVIRTGELLAARALDGGEQFFTRAFDFGYSKSIDEALGLWPLEDVLRDAVYVVRSFRPHVIVAVFSGTPGDGHGQHQVAGVVAHDVFAAAGDPDRYPELARWGVEPWSPAKLYQSVRFSPRDATLAVPTGTFDPVLGRSHFQLAMESRSQHRSQDMGSGQFMGPRSSSLRLEQSRVGAGTAAAGDDGVFAGVDTTLFGQLPDPLPGGWPADTRERLNRYRQALAEAAGGFSMVQAEGAVAGLSEAASILRNLVDQAPDGAGRRQLEHRLGQVSEAVLAAAGVVADVRVGRDLLTPGESVVVDVNVWNGGSRDLNVVDPSLLLPEGWTASPTEESAAGPSRSPLLPAFGPGHARRRTDRRGRDRALELAGGGAARRASLGALLPRGGATGRPIRLARGRNPVGASLRSLADPGPRGHGLARPPQSIREALKGDRNPAWRSSARASTWGSTRRPGEYRERVLVIPAVTASVEPRRMAWPTASRDARDVTVVLTNNSASARSGAIRLDVPAGWGVEPEEVPFAAGFGWRQRVVHLRGSAGTRGRGGLARLPRRRERSRRGASRRHRSSP